MPGSAAWGAYVQVCSDVVPTGNTITGAGQVTVVHSAEQSITGLTSVSGTWQLNATVNTPTEAPMMAYTSVGFILDNPQIVYSNTEETLLFTFEMTGNVGSMPYLIDNQSDPFNQLPNSASSNPGNDLSVLDMGVSPTGFYHYTGNYAGTGPNCETPVDTTVVNNPDSTGNGGETPTPTLEEVATEGFFTLSPNPTHEWLNVDFAEDFIQEKGTVRFWTVTGVPLGEMEKGNQERMTLNVGSLPDGLYLLSFEVDGEIRQRMRFLKQ